MAYVDVDLELTVLRVNVSGIRSDVRDVKTGVMRRRRSGAPPYSNTVAEQDARYDRLQQFIERINERLAALELRCSCRSLAAAGLATIPPSSRIEEPRDLA